MKIGEETGIAFALFYCLKRNEQTIVTTNSWEIRLLMDVELLVLTWRGTDNCTTFVAELQYRLSESGFIVIRTRQTT